MKRCIVVNLQYEATHCWPGVVKALPTKPSIWFLQFEHRHLFHMQLVKEVNHSDRDVEIILFKQQVLQDLQDTFNGDFGTQSCEMLAEWLIEMYDLAEATVLEDGENGARIIK